MPKFLWKVSYTPAGVKGLLEEGGTSRSQVIDQLVQGLGGKLEAFYYALGDADVYCIVDLPDNASVAAVSMTVAAAGAASLSTVALLTPEEIDDAAEKSVDYRPPGS